MADQSTHRLAGSSRPTPATIGRSTVRPDRRSIDRCFAPAARADVVGRRRPARRSVASPSVVATVRRRGRRAATGARRRRRVRRRGRSADADAAAAPSPAAPTPRRRGRRPPPAPRPRPAPRTASRSSGAFPGLVPGSRQRDEHQPDRRVRRHARRSTSARRAFNVDSTMTRPERLRRPDRPRSSSTRSPPGSAAMKLGAVTVAGKAVKATVDDQTIHRPARRDPRAGPVGRGHGRLRRDAPQLAHRLELAVHPDERHRRRPSLDPVGQPRRRRSTARTTAIRS